MLIGTECLIFPIRGGEGDEQPRRHEHGRVRTVVKGEADETAASTDRFFDVVLCVLEVCSWVEDEVFAAGRE